MSEVVLLFLASIPLMVCAELAIWAFRLRPLIRRHGGTSVTAANWGLSICADLTTAWEIRRKMDGFPPSAIWILLLTFAQPDAIVLVIVMAVCN